MNQFWCSVLSCSDLDNQKQSRISKLLHVLQWMHCGDFRCKLPVSYNVTCLPVSYIYSSNLSNIKNLGRNFHTCFLPKLSTEIPWQIVWSFEGIKKKNKTKPTFYCCIINSQINSLCFDKYLWLVPHWKVPMRWTFYLAQTVFCSFEQLQCW